MQFGGLGAASAGEAKRTSNRRGSPSFLTAVFSAIVAQTVAYIAVSVCISHISLHCIPSSSSSSSKGRLQYPSRYLHFPCTVGCIAAVWAYLRSVPDQQGIQAWEDWVQVYFSAWQSVKGSLRAAEAAAQPRQSLHLPVYISAPIQTASAENPLKYRRLHISRALQTIHPRPARLFALRRMP